MVITDYIIDILHFYLNLEFMVMWFFPLIALGFLSICPSLIRSFVSWR